MIRRSSQNAAVATVNGEVVTYKDFSSRMLALEEQINQLRGYARSSGISFETFMQMYGLSNPTQVALDGVVYEKLVHAVLKPLWVSLHEDVVSSELLKVLPADFVTSSGSINQEAYRKYIQRQHSPNSHIADFENRKEEEMTQELFSDFVRLSAYSPAAHRRALMEQKLAKKAFSLVKIEFDSVRHDLGYDPTTEEREAYYTNHKENYRVAEKRDFSYWVLSPSVAEKRVDVPEDVVEKFYKKNKSSLYRVPPRVKVRHIFIKEGENAQQLAYDLHSKIAGSPSSFAELAEKHSDDGETAKKGGLRDFFSRGTYDKAFENAALRLKKPEDLSPVVKSEAGYEIIQLVERIPAREKELSEVREEVERAVRGKRALEWLRAHLERIRKDADGNKELVREITGETSRKIRNNVEQSEANTYSVEGLVVQNGFTLRGEGNYSFFMHDDNYVLIQLNKKTGSFIPALKQVQRDVESDIVAQKTREKIDEIARKVRTDLVAGKEASSVADEYNVRFMKSEPIMVTQAQHSPFHGQAPMLRKAFMLNSAGQALRHDADKDVYLVQLRSVESTSAQEAADAMNDIEHINTTLDEQATAVSRAFIANLRRSAKIEINEKMLTVRPGQVA